MNSTPLPLIPTMTASVAGVPTPTTNNNNNIVVVSTTVSEWAERNHGAIRAISTTDDGEYDVQIGKLQKMGSQLVESTLQEVRGLIDNTFAPSSCSHALPSTTPILPTTSSTPFDNNSATSNTNINTLSQLQQDLCDRLEKRDAKWRPVVEELNTVKRLLSDANLLHATPSLPPSITTKNLKGKSTPATAQPAARTEVSSVLPSIEALVAEVLSLRKQSSQYSMVVSNLVGAGGLSPSFSSTLLPPITSPPPNKSSLSGGGVGGGVSGSRQYISSSHDQLTQALKKASSQQHQDLQRDDAGSESAPTSSPFNNGYVDASIKRSMRKNYEDMYVRGEERQYPRPCYVALGESEDRRAAVRGATVVQDNAYTSNGSPNGGMFANEPGSVTWASSANAHKYGYDSNTQQHRQPRHQTSPSPDLFVGVKRTPGVPASAQGGSVPLSTKHNAKLAAVVTQHNPFFRHHEVDINVTRGMVDTQSSTTRVGGVTKGKTAKGRILSEIERRLEDGYRTHKFVTVDVAAENEGLEYIEEEDDDEDADADQNEKPKTNDDDDDEFDPEVSMVRNEMQSEEKRDQKYRERKRRKPGTGGINMAGIALGTGSGLVVTEAEVNRRTEQAQLLRDEEAARIRAGGKQKRSQVQMMVSNNFAKMAAKGEKVDPFAMVRYGDIETIQDRRRASTGAIQAILHTVAQEVQQYKINQSGGGTAATLPGGEEDRRVVPTLRPSQVNCATSLQSDSNNAAKSKKSGNVLSSSKSSNISTSNRNSIAESTMRQLASKSKVPRGPPRGSDDDD